MKSLQGIQQALQERRPLSECLVFSPNATPGEQMMWMQDEMRRLEGIEHAEEELNMLQQAHAIAAAQQEMARLAAADHRAAIAQHEHKLQQMHEAQVCCAVDTCGLANKSMLNQHYLAAVHAFESLPSPPLPLPTPSSHHALVGSSNALSKCGQVSTSEL